MIKKIFLFFLFSFIFFSFSIILFTRLFHVVFKAKLTDIGVSIEIVFFCIDFPCFDEIHNFTFNNFRHQTHRTNVQCKCRFYEACWIVTHCERSETFFFLLKLFFFQSILTNLGTEICIKDPWILFRQSICVRN